MLYLGVSGDSWSQGESSVPNYLEVGAVGNKYLVVAGPETHIFDGDVEELLIVVEGETIWSDREQGFRGFHSI